VSPKVTDRMYVIWLATLGLDRVDFSRGHAPFLVTPFILVSLILLALEGVSMWSRDASQPRRYDKTLNLAFMALVGPAAVYQLLTPDSAINTSRLLLFCFQIGASVVLVGRVLARAQAAGLLYKGARLGILLAALSSVLQVRTWFAIGPDISKTYWVFQSSSLGYGTFAPRLSGLSVDPNRGALGLVLYGALIVLATSATGATDASKRDGGWLLALSLLLTVGTFSRSGLLSWVVAVGWMLCRNRQRGVTLRQVAGPSIIVAAGAWLAFSAFSSRPVSFGALLHERGNLGSGSSGGVHLELFSRALDVVNQGGFRTLLTGVGFGNASAGLTDVFNGSAYANFHSSYLGALVDTGICGLGVTILVTLYSVARAGNSIALGVGLALFNISYQTTLEPVAWVIIAFCGLGGLSPQKPNDLLRDGEAATGSVRPRPASMTLR
jgi:hypothetical protein